MTRKPRTKAPTHPPDIFADITELPAIHFRDDSQAGRYHRLSKCEILAQRTFNWDILEKFGWLNTLKDDLDVMGWWKFANFISPCYKEMVVEFLSSLKVVEKDVFGFRFLNTEFQISLRRIGEILKLPLPVNGVLGAPRSTQESVLRNRLWRRISGTKTAHHHHTKASEIISPHTRLLHRWIAHMLNCRATSQDGVTQEDLFALYCFQAPEKINGPSWIVDRWCVQCNKNRGKIYGSYICAIILNTVPPFAQDIFTLVEFRHSRDAIGETGLRNMRVIAPYHMRNHNGEKKWLRVPEDGSVPEGYIRPEPEHNPEIDRVSKRRRRAANSSSTPPDVSESENSDDDHEDAPAPTPIASELRAHMDRKFDSLTALIHSMNLQMDGRVSNIERDVRDLQSYTIPPYVPHTTIPSSQTVPPSGSHPMDDLPLDPESLNPFH